MRITVSQLIFGRMAMLRILKSTKKLELILTGYLMSRVARTAAASSPHMMSLSSMLSEIA